MAHLAAKSCHVRRQEDGLDGEEGRRHDEREEGAKEKAVGVELHLEQPALPSPTRPDPASENEPSLRNIWIHS